MNHLIPLRRPGTEVGDTHEVHAEFSAGPLDLYGRHHEVTKAEADIGVTRLSEGLQLDVRVIARVHGSPFGRPGPERRLRVSC